MSAKPGYAMSPFVRTTYRPFALKEPSSTQWCRVARQKKNPRGAHTVLEFATTQGGRLPRRVSQSVIGPPCATQHTGYSREGWLDAEARDQDDEGGEVEQTKTRSRRRKAALGHAGHTHTHVFQSPHSPLVLQEQDAHEKTLKPNGVACTVEKPNLPRTTNC